MQSSRDDRGDKLVIAKNAFKGFIVYHLAVVKNFAPFFASHLADIWCISCHGAGKHYRIRGRYQEAGQIHIQLCSPGIGKPFRHGVKAIKDPEYLPGIDRFSRFCPFAGVRLTSLYGITAWISITEFPVTDNRDMFRF